MTTTHAASDQIDQFEAARTGNLQWFKQQRAAGTLPDLTVDDEQHQLVIEYAAENGHLNIVKYLIEDSGQDVDVTSCSNYAVRYAAENGHLDVVKYLIEECDQKIDVTVRNSYALRHAAQNGHLNVVKYLIEECDQDVDATADDNYALYYAVKNDHLSVVKYLIEKCPQYIDLPALSQILLRTAIDYEHSELVKYLTPLCEVVEAVGSVSYEKIRPILLNSDTSSDVDTVAAINTTTNDVVSENLANNTSEISELSLLSFTDMLQYLSAIPLDVLQTLSASAEGLQQLRVYLQKVSSDTAFTPAAKIRVPRL